MVTQISNGVKVSVETNFEGRLYRKDGSLFVFVYNINIENVSTDPVKLIGRHWFIFDTKDTPSEVIGEGVVGKQPTLKENEIHTYQSGCHLKSDVGAMRGVFFMKNLFTLEHFEVKIPTFQLIATPRLN